MNITRKQFAAGGLVVFVVVLVPAAMVLRSWMDSDSTGTVSVGRASAGADTSQAQPVSIDNAWFSAALPAGFSIKSQGDTNDPHQLYGVDSTISGGAQMELTIEYESEPAGIAGDGSYSARVNDPANYARYSVPGAPAGSIAFRDLNNPYSSAAYVVFMPHGSNYVVIGLTGGLGATLDQLNAQFSALMSTWQWK